ncbi:hypothetical protein EON65_58360 [archaeon]|nr:MAG: hypothetical protein EON65_58360 [archaeon]
MDAEHQLQSLDVIDFNTLQLLSDQENLKKDHEMIKASFEKLEAQCDSQQLEIEAHQLKIDNLVAPGRHEKYREESPQESCDKHADYFHQTS